MIDLSDNKEVKIFCKYFFMNFMHDMSDNMSSMDKYCVESNYDWEGIRQRCRNLIRLSITIYYNRYNCPFTLGNKIDMADNLLEYFKNKHKGKYP